MKLIAIETSERVGSLCALSIESGDGPGGEQVAIPASLPAGVRSAQSLAPCLKELIEKTSWPLAELDAVAVSSGPGSFTGLRIGVTAAKMLAYAAGCGVVEVNTLHAIAAQSGGAGGPGWVVMDAQRNELFAAPVDADGACGEVAVLPVSKWLSELSPGVWVSGPVVRKLRSELPQGVSVAEESSWAPQAETIARLAAPRVAAGELAAATEVLPRYFRLSAAEEKRLGQGAP